MKNKGFSLVELLVAMSIAAIVAGSVGYLLTTSLRMFGNETTNIELQQELQTSLNQIIDYAMESQTVVVKNSGSSTDYLALGTVDKGDSTKLNAQVFFTHDGNLYMCKTPINDYDKVQETAPRNLDEKVSKIKEDALNDADSLPQYLLAENVTSFYAKLNGTKTVGTDNLYDNPLNLDLSLEFAKTGSSKEIHKKVSDKAVFRNTLNTKIYSDGVCYKSKKDALVITTETVKMEEKTGNIQIPGTSTVAKKSLNILEIVPDYSYDYLQYVVGGYDGKLTNDVNVIYSSKAIEDGYEPITPEEIEGYFIRACGGQYYNDHVDPKDNYFPNENGASLSAIVLTPEADKNGYYEYVGKNKGVYAISSYDELISLASTEGRGDAKPKVVSYTQKYNEYNEDKKYWTDKVFNPVFEFCEEDIQGEDFYKIDVVTPDDRGDYIEVTKDIDDKTYTYYEYVGSNNGSFSVTFCKENDYAQQSYDAGKNYCYRVSQSHGVIDEQNGKYYARIDGWEKREESSYGSDDDVWGYDFNRYVTSAIMYSKYSTAITSGISNDFGWIWKDAEPDSSLNTEIEDGIARTYVGTLYGGSKLSGEEFERKTRLYLKGHRRYGIVNNDLFKLFVMQDALEQYVNGTPKMLDIMNGRWDVTNNKFCTVNDEAIKAWEDAGNKITVNVRKPSEVSTTDVADCDMVILGKNGDGGFDWANTFYNAIRKSGVTYKSFSATNDISFEVATEIYKRVCSEEISIACPYEIEDISDGGKELNLSKLYKMVYCVSNWTQTDEELKRDVIGKRKEEKIGEQGDDNYWSIDPDYMKDIKVMRKGSGRDLYKDFLISMVGEELSKSLYADGTLPNKTTEFIYIDLNGNIVIPSQSARNVSQKVGTTSYSYSNRGYGETVLQKFDIYTDSAGKYLGKFEANFLIRDYTGNNFLLDRYRSAISRDASKYTPYDKTEYVYNEEYGYRYRFYYDSAHEGVYKNSLLYMSTSNLFTFYKTGASGMLQLGVANQNAHPTTEIDDPDIIGTVEYVGADDVETGDAKWSEMTDTGNYTYEDYPSKYAFRLERLGNGTNKKVFYMSYEDYEEARDKGLYLYVLVKTSKDPSNYNKCVLRYNQNEEDGGAPGRFDYDAYNYSNNNNENSVNVKKYKSGTEANEVYVREYRYHANPEYFQHIYAPNNKGNNLITAKIDDADGKHYVGSDELYFIIRDEFDLD